MKTQAQQHLPGIDPGELRYKALTDKYPPPDTKELAELFFRNLEKEKGIAYCIDANIKLKKGYDILRVVLKTKTEEEMPAKHEFKADLDRSDPQEYDRLFIDTAMKIYVLWLEYEKQKQ